jgi:hypothetical protein
MGGEVGAAVTLIVREGNIDGEDVHVPLWVFVSDGEAVVVFEALFDIVRLDDEEIDPVRDTDQVADALGVAEDTMEAVGVPVSVAVGVGARVFVVLAVIDGEAERVAVPVPVDVGDGEGKTAPPHVLTAVGPHIAMLKGSQAKWSIGLLAFHAPIKEMAGYDPAMQDPSLWRP